MKYATYPASTHAPNGGATRAHRIGQVKFVALVLEPEAAPEAETHSSSPARLYRAVRASLLRVFERLVAARP